MDAVANPASVATWVSLGFALAMSLVGALVATSGGRDQTGYRDRVGLVMLGIAFALTMLLFAAGMLFAAKGPAFLGLVQFTLVLMGIFAIVGAGFGAVRGLRRGHAAHPPAD